MLDQKTIPLPRLREDLQYREGPSGHYGTPTWTVYDPARGKYFRIGWAYYQLLTRWSKGTVTALLHSIKQDTTCQLGEQDVMDLIRFLHANNLTEQPVNGGYDAYLQQYRASRPPWYQQLVHHYLFFRLPLVRPNRFLHRTLPYLQFCFDLRFAYLLLALALLSIYLVSRQWEVYWATFLHFFNWQGLFFYGLAIGFSKLLHELGHAYTAARYGCRVPVMGLAFMAMLPMPYTDVSDAWRLSSKQQRLAIGAAGMITEIALAIIATFAWNFLPDGPVRGAAFLLSSSTWLITLSVNLSPLMRFDGYYLLSDAWGIENLQARAFAIARWRLRRWLFADNQEPPEILPKATMSKMVVYSYITWLYRLMVFTGLALLVYHFFFKLLGIVLFAVEIVWFIAKPIIAEFKQWRLLAKQAIPLKHPKLIALSVILIVVGLITPWHDTVYLPAILRAERHTTVYPPQPARIAQVLVTPGQRVTQGQLLFKLESPKLEDDILLSRKRLDYYKLRLERATTTREESSDLQVAMQQWSTESAKLAGLEQQLKQLNITAPFAATVTDIATGLHAKRWLNTEQALATLVAPGAVMVQSLADAEAVAVLALAQTGKFIADDGVSSAIPVTVTEIDKVNVHSLDSPYFASIYDGQTAVQTDPEHRLIPTQSVFAVRLKPDLLDPPKHIQRGIAVINAKPRSFIQRMFDITAAVLIRESGF